MGLTVLDAGVLIAGLEIHDVHHLVAAAAMRDAIRRGDSTLLPASAYAEVLVLPASISGPMLRRTDVAIDDLGIMIIPADRDIAREAAKLRAKHRTLRLPDALVIATAITRDADHLLTTDKRWKRLRGLGVRGLEVIG